MKHCDESVCSTDKASVLVVLDGDLAGGRQ